jgi:trimeric autotransporter adhesin
MSAQPVINTVAGDGRHLQGVGGPATGVALADPYFLGLDASGNLYVSDRIYNTVAAITPGGTLTQFVGSGVFGFSGDGGPATQADFRFALGLTFDGAGNAYIADAENGRVRRVTPGRIIQTIAGSANCCASNMGDGGPATQAWLSITSSATIGPDGLLYIADTYHHCIRKLDVNGIITTVAGHYAPGSIGGTGGFSGDNGPATQASLNLPTRVVFDSSGNMYISDQANYRIRKVTPGGTITTFAGGGSQNPVDGVSALNISLSYPHDVAIDGSDNVYVADTYGGLIMKVNPLGIVTVVAGIAYSMPSLSGDGGPATAATLWDPESVAVDKQGNIFIADEGNERVRRVDSQGIITTWAGNGGSNYSGDSGPALQASLDRPQGVTMDPAGNLLIADVYNNRIRKVDAVTGIISTIAGTGVAAYGGDGQQAVYAGLSRPRGVAADTKGNIFIADTGNGRIRKIDSSGNISTFAGGASGGSPCGAPVPAMSGVFTYPVGIAVDQSGNLFIADSASPCVSSVGADGVLRVVAGTGTAGFSGDGGPGPSAALRGPTGVLPDGKGGLYIADNLNSRVRYVSSSGIITTVAGTGMTGFSQPNGPGALQTNMEYPAALALGRDGTLYIIGSADPLLHLTTNGLIFADIPDPNEGFIGDGGPVSAAEMNVPQGVTTDANGDLYIADTQNDRIRKVTLRSLALSTQNVTVGVAPGAAAAITPLTITNTGEGVLDWTAIVTTDQTGGWLTVSAAPGTAPSNVTISANPGSLAAGTYTGKVTVSSPAAVRSPATIAVTMNVIVGFTPVTVTSVNVAGGLAGIAQNAWIEIHGSNLTPASVGPNGMTWSNAPDFASGKMPTQLANVSVTVNGNAAYVYFVSSSQVNVLTPFDNTVGSAPLVVTNGGNSSPPFAVNLQKLSPSFFHLGATQYIAATHGDGSLLGPASMSVPGYPFTPAQPGETIVLYATGFAVPETPQVAGSSTQYGLLGLPLTVSIGGTATSVPFAGLVSPGLYQFNVVVPASSANGDIPVSLAYGGVPAPIGSVIAVLSAPGPNLIQNGSFESPLAGNWVFSQDGSTGAAATITRDDSTSVDGNYSAEIDVITAAAMTTATSPCLPCAVQFYQGGIAMEQGHTYSLQFSAKADAARTMRIGTSQNGGSFQGYGLSTTVSIGANWQPYQINFQSTATDPAARLNLYFGDRAGTTWLDAFVLEDTSP